MTNVIPAVPARYTKKPVTISAVIYPADLEGQKAAAKWVNLNGGRMGVTRVPVLKPMQEGSKETMLSEYSLEPVIETLEGHLHVSVGDYIIKGLKGEFYPCKPDIFEMSYNKE